MMVTAQEIDELRKKITDKENSLTTLQDEIDELKAELKKKGKEFVKDIGLDVSTPTTKRSGGAKSDKSGERWRTKAILEIIEKGKFKNAEALKEELQKQKPNAKLDKLDGYLTTYTQSHGSRLILNDAGKEQIKSAK